MELELETREELDAAGLHQGLSRLTAAAAALEAAAARLNTFDLEATQSREHQLAGQLAEAEATIKRLEAAAPRKTAAPGTLLSRESAAREGVALEAGTLDGALSSLSIEQRIAVKAQLLRAGLLG